MADRQIAPRRPVSIVVDTNEWIRLKWFGGPLGVSLIAAISVSENLRLVVPEVLNIELVKHRTKAANDLLDAIGKASTELKLLTGDFIGVSSVR